MSEDKLFGEGMPGTGGDFISQTDVEGHGNKQIDPKPLGADAGPDESIPSRRFPGVADEDTEGHSRNPLYRNAVPDDAGPEGLGGKGRAPIPEIGGKGRSPMPEISGDDVEGHRRNYQLPGATEDAGPDGFGRGTTPMPPSLNDEDDVEGHMGGMTVRRPTVAPDDFVKRGPDEMPHGDRLK